MNFGEIACRAGVSCSTAHPGRTGGVDVDDTILIGLCVVAVRHWAEDSGHH